MLEELGLTCDIAEDGIEAVKMYDNKKYDLVLMDENMPNMNGVELTESLRLDPAFRFIPVVFLTTESQMQKKQAAKNAGATGWIVKPFKPEQLVRVVKKVLG